MSSTILPLSHSTIFEAADDPLYQGDLSREKAHQLFCNTIDRMSADRDYRQRGQRPFSSSVHSLVSRMAKELLACDEAKRTDGLRTLLSEVAADHPARALEQAASVGYTEAVCRFLREQPENFSMALSSAARANQIDLVKNLWAIYLRDRHLPLYSKNLKRHDQKVLLATARVGDVEGVRALIDKELSSGGKGIDPSQAMQGAAAKGHVGVVSEIIGSGIYFFKGGLNVGPALIAAVEGGHQEVVYFLLNRAAGVHWKDEEMEIALEKAMRLDNLDILDQLLDYHHSLSEEKDGFELFRKNIPFWHAALKGRIDIVKKRFASSWSETYSIDNVIKISGATICAFLRLMMRGDHQPLQVLAKPALQLYAPVIVLIALEGVVTRSFYRFL